MTSLNIGSGITSLGSEVFGQCSSLTSVVIPPAINSIGNSAFNRCTKLVAAYFLGNAPVNVGTSVFDNCAAGFTVLYNSDKTGFGSTWYTYPTAVYGDLVAVCFDLNGGSGNSGACMSPGAALTAPTVTKYGNSFSRWSPAVPSSVPTVNSTYVAQWTPNSYTVVYNGNGATGGSTASSAHNYGVAKNLTANGFTKTGYTFSGWATSAGGVVAYSDAQSVSGLTSSNGVTVTLYAKWTALNGAVSITFDANGGLGGSTTSLIPGAALTSPTVTKTGYTFTGWTPTVPATVPSSDTTYTAQWIANYYTVNFSTSHGTVSPAFKPVAYGSVYGELPTPTVAGYTFGGWYTVPYISSPFYNGVRIFPSTQVTITQAQTLYARWTANTYTVTFDPQGGSVSPETVTVTYAGTYGVLPTPTGTDYTFGGWYTSPAGSGTQILNTTPVSITAAQTLYAKWTSNEPAPADYTQLNALMVQAETIKRYMYTENSVAALDEALGYAYDAENAEYDSSMQATVDEIADLLAEVLNSLEYGPADYSAINYVWDSKPASLNIFTDESVENLVTYYNEEIDWTLKADRQDVVDGYADALMILINALVLDTGADYTIVDNALKTIPDNDGDLIHVDFTYLYTIYTNSSVANLASAVNAVVRGKPITEQPVVDAYAAAIAAARNALDPLNADYTYLSIALNNAPAWPASYYMEDTYLAYTDELATGWALYNNQNLNITQQYIINDTVTRINEAYAALTLKDVTYTVKYQTGGGTTLAADVVKNATAAAWVTETAVAVPGYTPAQATIQQRMTGTSSENVILFTYTVAYTVTFNSNGGSAVAPVTGQAGDPITPPADPTRIGYLFSGWYTDTELTGTVLWPYLITGNATLYAKWTATTTYKITFNSNGGTSVAAVTQNANTAVAKPADPVKTGYTFKSWYLDSSFTTAVTWPYTLAANVTFYAKWTRNYYTVTFDAQGGTVDPGSRSIGYGYSYNPLPTPVKTDFVFMGWYTQPNGLGTRILGGDGVAIAQDHTIYAKWMPVTNVTVTLNAMGGTVSPATVAVTVGLPYGDLPIPTKAGYVFAGWYQSPPSYLSYDYVLSNFIVAKDFDHTLYAKWNNPRYNLSFDSNGGSSGMLLGYSLPAGTMVTISLFPYFAVSFDLPPGEDPIYVPQVMLELPTRPGYTFVGWSMSSFMMPAHDVTVYAIWSPNSPVNITFDTDGGSAIAPMNGNPGDPFTAPADPTRAGYTFFGWSPSIPPSIPDEDATYTAMWQVNSYMVTFDANGGTGGSSCALVYGSPLIPPIVARAGFVFAGWSLTLPATVGADDADYTALWRMIGDMNGNDSITAADALMALQVSAEIMSPTEIQLSAADVNHSGSVTSADALRILQFSAGLITSF